MQALANELNTAAKIDNTPFNILVRERTPHILANLEKATLQDLVVLLSSFGLRISRLLSGSKDLLRSKQQQDLVSKVAQQICASRMIETAHFAQVASLLWYFALLPNTMADYPELWSKLHQRIETIASEEPSSMVAPR